MQMCESTDQQLLEYVLLLYFHITYACGGLVKCCLFGAALLLHPSCSKCLLGFKLNTDKIHIASTSNCLSNLDVIYSKVPVSYLGVPDKADERYQWHCRKRLGRKR